MAWHACVRAVGGVHKLALAHPASPLAGINRLTPLAAHPHVKRRYAAASYAERLGFRQRRACLTINSQPPESTGASFRAAPWAQGCLDVTKKQMKVFVGFVVNYVANIVSA